MSVGLSGTVVVSAENKLSHEAVERRLTTLHRYLFGQRSTVTGASAGADVSKSLACRAKDLDDRLDFLETHDVKIFQIGLLDIGPRLGNWAKPRATGGTLAHPAKQQVVQSEGKFLEDTCRQLEEIKALQPYMNPSYLNEMPVYLERVSKLETNYIAISKKAEAFQRRLQKVLKNYNELVDLLSLKAAEWDEALRRLEDKVGV